MCTLYTLPPQYCDLWFNMAFTPHPYLDFRKYCNLINKFGCGSILKQWSDYCCVYVFFSAPINLSFHSSVQHGQGCCNLDDHGRLAVHAASVIVIRRRLLSNGRGGSKSAWWSIWWSSSIENWNAYFFGRRPVYLVFCSAYRCSRQMPRRIMGTYFMWGTRGAWWDFWSGRGFGEKRGQGTYTEVNLVHILLGGWCRCIL